MDSNNIQSMISRKGYIIEKTSISKEQLAKIKDDLIVEPIINNNYGQKIERFYVYSENEQRICIPKFYGIQELGQPTQYLEPKFDKIKIKFKGILKDQQLEPFNTTLNGLKEKFGGILSIPCGGGKTVITLALICALHVKTLVIVHKTFLANQWKERIAQFIPKARIGIIQQNKVDIEDKDIVIAMLQSISMKTYDPFNTIEISSLPGVILLK
jgi:superfamily II DNA or RNA helicase